MDNSTTKELTTPTGKKVVIREITAGELMDATEKELSKTELGKVIMHLSIVSIEGVTQDIPNVIRALPVRDFVYINKELSELITGDFTQAKTQV